MKITIEPDNSNDQNIRLLIPEIKKSVINKDLINKYKNISKEEFNHVDERR